VARTCEACKGTGEVPICLHGLDSGASDGGDGQRRCLCGSSARSSGSGQATHADISFPISETLNCPPEGQIIRAPHDLAADHCRTTSAVPPVFNKNEKAARDHACTVATEFIGLGSGSPAPVQVPMRPFAFADRKNSDSLPLTGCVNEIAGSPIRVLLTDELARQLAQKPHHFQAMVAAFPNGVYARELAVSLARKMEAYL